MKTLSKVVGALALAALLASPAFAAEGTSKPLGFIEFWGLSSNHGADMKTVIKRYDDYRSGRAPLATLDVSRLR